MAETHDRRQGRRLEVIGSLLGTLECAQDARVVDMSQGGALIALPVRLSVGTARTIRLTLAGQAFNVDGVVRHVTRIVRSQRAEYLVGVEFLSAPDLSAFL